MRVWVTRFMPPPYGVAAFNIHILNLAIYNMDEVSNRRANILLGSWNGTYIFIYYFIIISGFFFQFTKI